MHNRSWLGALPSEPACLVPLPELVCPISLFSFLVAVSVLIFVYYTSFLVEGKLCEGKSLGFLV